MQLLAKARDSGRGGIDLAQGGSRRLLEARDDLVDSPAGVAIGGFGAGPAADLGVGDDFDRLIDVIEDDQFAVEAEEQIGQSAVVLGRGMGSFSPS